MRGLVVTLILAAFVIPTGVNAAERAECANPPCGYILPILDLDFPDKPDCRAGFGVTDNIDDCPDLPAVGATVTYEGTMRYYWKLSEDGTYPSDPAAPITVTFGGTRSNPDWMDLVFEPASYVIDQAALLDPQNMKTVGDPGQAVVYYWFEAPVSVTITRTGEPDLNSPDPAVRESDQAVYDRIRSQGGLLPVFAKAASTASGAYFRESFGIEVFNFNPVNLEGVPAGTSESSKSSPAPAVFAFAALALAAMRRRR